MTPDPAFGPEQLIAELCRKVVDTVADLPGWSPEQRAINRRTAYHSVMGFQPRDPVEAMLAGQCVIYDHLLRDGVRDQLHTNARVRNANARPINLGAGKLFLSALAMLQRMRHRAASQAKAIAAETAQEAIPRTTLPDSAAAEPSPPASTVSAKPRFVSQRVHLPHRREASNTPAVGAMFRLPEKGPPAVRQPEETPRGRSFLSTLNESVSHAAMTLVAFGEPACVPSPGDPRRPCRGEAGVDRKAPDLSPDRQFTTSLFP